MKKPIAALLFTLASGVLLAQEEPSEPAPAPAPTDPVMTDEALPETVISGEGESSPETEMIAFDAPTALKLDAPIAEVPRSVSVITREQFEDRGIRTIQDTLLYTPGVYGGPFGYDSRGDWSLVRGVSPIDYVDGLRSLFSYYNNTRPHPYGLSSVEVIKGPSSVLYGQSSLGGILNSTSKLPQTRPYNEVYVSYGSYERLEGGFDFGGSSPDGQLMWRLVGAKREANSQVDYVPDDVWFLSPSVTWQPNEDTSLTFLANFQENETGTSAQFAPWEGTALPGRRLHSNIFLSEPDFDRYNTEQMAFTGIFEHQINEVFSFEGRARYTDASSDYQSIWPAFPPTIAPDGTIQRTLYISDASSEAFVSDARVRAEFNTGELEHNMSVGFDYQHAVTDNNSFYSYFGGGPLNIYNPAYGQAALTIGPVIDYPSTTFDQTGIYWNDRMELGRWIGTVGVRHDQLTTQTNDGVSPEDGDDATTWDAGLMYRFDNGVAPYVSYAQSFLPVAGTNLQNEPYDPRQGEQYEIGVKFQPEGTNNLFTLAFFDITEENRLTSAPGGVGSVQSGEVGIQGVELEAQTQWRDFYIQAGYSYLDAKITSSNDGNEGYWVSTVPDGQFSTWVTWRPSGAWQGFKAGFGVRHVGQNWDGADTLSTPSFTLFDAMIGWEEGPWDFTLNATNLADEEYLSTTLSRGDVFFGDRRFIGATVRYRF